MSTDINNVYSAESEQVIVPPDFLEMDAKATEIKRKRGRPCKVKPVVAADDTDLKDDKPKLKLTEEKIAAIQNDRKCGMTIAAICKRNTCTLWQYYRAAGESEKKCKLSKKDMNQIYKKYQLGVPLSRLAKDHNLSLHIIKSCISNVDAALSALPRPCSAKPSATQHM